jgi:hypothetical protein
MNSSPIQIIEENVIAYYRGLAEQEASQKLKPGITLAASFPRPILVFGDD